MGEYYGLVKEETSLQEQEAPGVLSSPRNDQGDRIEESRGVSGELSRGWPPENPSTLKNVHQL